MPPTALKSTLNTTIIEVAALAGVSKTTASDILRNPNHRYSAVTAERVQQAAAQLGYQANAAARLLRQQHSNLLGIAVQVRQPQHLNQLVVASYEECTRRGFQPALFEPDHLLPSENQAPFPSPELLAGIISIDLSLEFEVPHVYSILQKKVPLVALYPSLSKSVNVVTTDWNIALELAVQHLLELGHRDIAWVQAKDSPYPSDRNKNIAWAAAQRKFKLNSSPEYLIDLSVKDSLAEMGEKVAHTLLNMKKPPTALIGPGDEVVIYVLTLLAQAGWKVPHDLSVIGIDGIESGRYSYPPLTSIAQPYATVARIAVEQLVEKIKPQGATNLTTSQTLIAPTLQVRQSTAPPRSHEVRGRR